MTTVPVINKTLGLFQRDQKTNKIVETLDNATLELLASKNKIVTVKTDGTCGLLCKMEKDGSAVYCLMRRQDIKTGSKNFEHIQKNLNLTQVASRSCVKTTMIRGGGKNALESDLFIFQLDSENKPEVEVNHLIGFTPLTKLCGDDRHVLSSIVGENMTPNLKIWCTRETSCFDVNVELLDADKILNGKNLITVEIMGSTVSNKYGFKDRQHFINPHGSIICLNDSLPPLDNYVSLQNWFLSETRLSDVEGYVVHFPDLNRRLKVHRGHVDLGKTWRDKKSSGLVFHFVE